MNIRTISKIFIFSIFVLFTTFVYLVFVNNKQINLSPKIVKITNNSNFAYSNDIFEPRFKELSSSSNLVLFPLQISYLDFVYEK